MRARIAADQLDDRLGYEIQQRNGNSRRQRNAEAVAIAGAVFDGDEPFLARNAQFQDAARADEPVDLLQNCGLGDAQGQFLARKIAEAQQQIVDAVGRTGAEWVDEALLLLFDLRHGFGVEQLAQVGLAQEFPELILIDGERLRAPLG